MPRIDQSYEYPEAAHWLRAVLLPFLVLAVAVAIVCGVVFGGAVQGHKIYSGPVQAPTTQPTILIEP